MNKKNVARRKKLAERERRRAEFDERRAYPDFLFVENEAPRGFVELVKAAVARIDFRDREQFAEWEADIYKGVRAGRPVPEFRSRLPDGQEVQRFDVEHHFLTNLGEQVFRLIPPADLSRYIPHNDVLFLPHHRNVYVHFRSLCRAKGAGGTTYHSRHRPTVEVGGQRLVVGFSTHAIERACERTLARPLCYSNLGDVFAFFDQCLEFEVCRLPDGQLGFAFWESCPPGYWMRTTVEHILGEAHEETADYSYRVGYCPAVVEGDFIKAKTLLYPGWVGTPEYLLLRAAQLPAEQRRKWFGLLDAMDGMRFRVEAGPLLKWFHEQGVKQVRPGEPRYAPAVRSGDLVSATRLRRAPGAG